MEQQINNNYEPKVIAMNRKRYLEALTEWEKYVETASWLKAEITGFLNLEMMENEQFFKIIALDKDEIILELFRQSDKVPENINLQKAIELGIVDNEYQTQLNYTIEEFFKKRRYAETLFKYDLSKLSDEEGLFSITNEFKKTLTEKFTTYTRNEGETEVLKHLEQIRDSFNSLAKLGITKPNAGIIGLNRLLKAFRRNENGTGYELDSRALKFLRVTIHSE